MNWPTVAAEAQQCPEGPGGVVVVDMRRGLNPADGAGSSLFFEHGISVSCRDPVTAPEVISAFAAHEVLGHPPTCVVAWLAVRRHP